MGASELLEELELIEAKSLAVPDINIRARLLTEIEILVGYSRGYYDMVKRLKKLGITIQGKKKLVEALNTVNRANDKLGEAFVIIQSVFDDEKRRGK